MPDWEGFVQRELGKLKLPREEKQEVLAELAGHFEDCENHASPQTDDLNRSYWRKLSCAIEHAKRESE